MKNLKLLSALLLFVISINVSAQTSEEKIVGKWNMVWYELPAGDVDVMMEVKMEDGKLVGIMNSPKTQTGDRLDNVAAENFVIDGDNVTWECTIKGHDLSISVDLIKENEFEGFLGDMFEIVGTKEK